MLNKDQSQDADNGAVAVQAGGNANVNIIHVGITAAEARAIALDVSKATFFELSADGKITANQRIEEITDKVIEKLENEYPEGLQKAREPDFQYALYTVQKQYARCGDKELGDLLVDLLVDRSKQNLRDIRQIVLNESLETAPKLTDAQLANLAIIFAFRYTINHGIGNNETLGLYFDNHVLPFHEKLTKSQASFQHMEFAGCGASQVTSIDLGEVLQRNYPGLFTKGFTLDEVGEPIDILAPYLTHCLNDPHKLQIASSTEKNLAEKFSHLGTPVEDQQKIKNLLQRNLMEPSEIAQKCIELRPYMSTIFDIWDNSNMKTFTLTSVGIAIGHANLKRFVGDFADLSKWIN